MSGLTPDDVHRWDAEAVLKVFQIATNRASTLYRFGEDLGQTGQLLAEWEGEAGTAFHSSLGRLRSDVDKDGHESTQVAAAVSTASADVQTCKSLLSQVDETAETLGFTITEDWKVNVGDTEGLLMGPQAAELQRQILQADLDAVKIKAHTTDHELATAMRAAVSDPSSVPTVGRAPSLRLEIRAMRNRPRTPRLKALKAMVAPARAPGSPRRTGTWRSALRVRSPVVPPTVCVRRRPT